MICAADGAPHSSELAQLNCQGVGRACGSAVVCAKMGIIKKVEEQGRTPAPEASAPCVPSVPGKAFKRPAASTPSSSPRKLRLGITAVLYGLSPDAPAELPLQAFLQECRRLEDAVFAIEVRTYVRTPSV